MWVTVWVRILTHTLARNKCCQEVRKTPDFRTKSDAFGAGGVIRTHDLLITNQLLYLLSYTSKGALFDARCIVAQKKCFVNTGAKIFYCGAAFYGKTPAQPELYK